MTVIWTPTAEITFAEELAIISNQWTIIELTNFIDLVDDFVRKLESGVIEGKISAKTNIYSFVISKQTTLYFDVHTDTKIIQLLLFWNNKRDPKTLKKLIDRF
ncbi:hypothetical protein Q2T40_17265 [Winogradskyella maritima]|uniref:Plasmid stabilization system protein ParE n=1 Tax=Winogradskyella maritima TaxID=1517766 RepID=A0ABV8AFR1_9FLAO|nr:hypothetical protein [Winogradskyella maritima]